MTGKSKTQDGSSSDESIAAKPATMDPAAEKLLDKAMTPNQPPPLHRKADKAAGRKAEIERQQLVQDAVKLANVETLPSLGGNTWDTAAEAGDK